MIEAGLQPQALEAVDLSEPISVAVHLPAYCVADEGCVQVPYDSGEGGLCLMKGPNTPKSVNGTRFQEVNAEIFQCEEPWLNSTTSVVGSPYAEEKCKCEPHNFLFFCPQKI
jgi:hypothetical protein